MPNAGLDVEYGDSWLALEWESLDRPKKLNRQRIALRDGPSRVMRRLWSSLSLDDCQ